MTTATEMSLGIVNYVRQNGTNPFVLPDGSLPKGTSEKVRGQYYRVNLTLADGRQAQIDLMDRSPATPCLEIMVAAGKNLPALRTREYHSGQVNLIRIIDPNLGDTHFSAVTAKGALETALQLKYEEILEQVYNVVLNQ